MKKSLRIKKCFFQILGFLILGCSLIVASSSKVDAYEDQATLASFGVSVQDEAEFEETPQADDSTDIVEYEDQELEENLSPEDQDPQYMQQEDEEDYILVDEEGNVIDEDILQEEAGEEFEEVVDSESDEFGDHNIEDEDLIYIEEGEVIEEGSSSGEEYEDEPEGIENEEEHSPAND